jgi:ABC-type Na+ transport system ATPase subunit NatA
VVKDLNLVIQPGQIFGLLGPSGAGKSTTQKVLIKLLPGYQGEVLYLGKPLSSWKQNFYEDIGVGFEMPVHFNKLTAMENLKYFSSLYKKHINIEAMMVRVGLGEAMHQPVGQYSKGMKMRLNFVKALLNDPQVLFLDEPTNGLDPSNARIIKDIILEEKKKGKTILITTHLMGDVEECGGMPSMGPMSSMAPKQQDNVTMNVSMNGSGAGGIRDLMGILKNIENGGEEPSHSHDDNEIVVGMGEEQVSGGFDSATTRPNTETQPVSAVLKKGPDIHGNMGDHRPRQAGLPRAQMENLVSHLNTLYQEVKGR